VKTDGSIKVLGLDEPTLKALALADDWLVSQQLEQTAEYKAGSIAVHWRGLNTTEAEDIHRRVMLGWTSIAKQARLDLLPFDCGVEIRSKNANKGAAVRTFSAKWMRTRLRLIWEMTLRTRMPFRPSMAWA